MSIDIVGIVTLLAGAASFWLGLGFGLPALVGATLLQASAAMIVPGIGNIQPAHALLGFMMLIGFADQRVRAGAILAVRFPRPGFWLMCTWIYGLGAAYFVPRFFADAMSVFAVSASDQAFGSMWVPLRPSNGNLTQSMYFTGDLILYLLLQGFARSSNGFRLLANGLMLFCALDVALGLLDIVTTNIGAAHAMDVIRNSTYNVLSDATVGSLPRIIGSFTEASAFATATTCVFCIATRLWLGGLYPKAAFPVSLLSFVFLIFGTSTTGYIALVPCCALLYAGAVVRLVRRDCSYADFILVVLAPLVLGIGVLLVFLNHALLTVISDFLDQILFNKGTSQSGLERGTWNTQALESLYQSYGLGVGLGSARASSLIFASLSNLGVPGSFFYALFMITTFFASPPSRDRFVRHVRGAARLGCVAGVVTEGISGTLVEPGLWFIVFTAVAAAIPEEVLRPSKTRDTAGYGTLEGRASPAPSNRFLPGLTSDQAAHP